MTIKPKAADNGVHIGDDIAHALQRSSFVDAGNVKVSSKGGRIHLTGTFHGLHDRLVDANIAWSAEHRHDVMRTRSQSGVPTHQISGC